MAKRSYSMGDGMSMGFLLGMLNFQLEHLISKVGALGYRHNMLENINIIFEEELSGREKDDVNKNLAIIINLEKFVDNFNKSIEHFNKKVLENMSSYPKLPILKTINKKELLLQLNRRFLKSYNAKESQELANEVLDLKIISLINESVTSIINFKDFFSDLNKDIDINVSKKYVRGFREAEIVLSWGCFETAVFVAGRTIESLINDLLINEIKKSNIETFDLKNTKLETKIGKLKGISIISEKEFHILQKLKFDRNDFGHPFDRDISFNEAKRIILDALDLAKDLEKKLV